MVLSTDRKVVQAKLPTMAKLGIDAWVIQSIMDVYKSRQKLIGEDISSFFWPDFSKYTDVKTDKSISIDPSPAVFQLDC